jgi:hypothetical protein
MGTFRLSAWCLDPALSPREIDVHIVEPDEPPSLEDMVAPAQAVVPPHVSTLAYPLLIHVTSTVDFRRSTPRQGNGDRAVDGDGSTPAWPTRRQYPYTRGTPDVLPGSGGGDSAAAHPAPAGQGGRGGSARVLASGVIVGEAVVAPSLRAKRRKRGGRNVREIRARAAAESAGAGSVEELAATGAGAERAVVVCAETSGERAAMSAEEDRVVAAATAVATAAGSAATIGVGCHAPVLATVDPSVQGPVQRSVDQVLVAQRAVVDASHVMVGPLVDCPVLEASALGSNLAADGGVGEGTFRMGALTVSLPASPRKDLTSEPPSLQTLDQVAAPLMGLEASASPAAALHVGPREEAGPFDHDGAGVRDFARLPSPLAARQDGSVEADGLPSQVVAGPFCQVDVGLSDLAGAVLTLSDPSSPRLDAPRVEELGDDEVVDEEIVVDPPPSQNDVDSSSVVPPTTASPSVCRFATPPLVFQRERQAPVPRAPVPLARPRTFGEFLEAAKSRSDALLQTHGGWWS